MKTLASILAIAVLALAFVGCPKPTPGPNPPPDASDGGDDLDASRASCSKACANLTALGCPITDCPTACVASQGKLTDLHPACLAKAKTKEEARACGSVKCP
jgi:hypothetical protein